MPQYFRGRAECGFNGFVQLECTCVAYNKVRSANEPLMKIRTGANKQLVVDFLREIIHAIDLHAACI